MSEVAFVGTGAMGSRMAHRLIDAGHSMCVWNRTAEKADSLVNAGAKRAGTPADAVTGADAVITMLADERALRTVVEGSDGIAAALTDGATVIEMSTVGPGATEWLAGALPDGVDLLDAPVLGSLSEAEAGKLKVFAGGEKDVFERWHDLLSSMGQPVHVGPVGAGTAAKLVANSTLFGSLSVTAEAIALGDGLGLPRDVTFEVLSFTPVAAQAERRREAVESDDYPVRFALALALKDATLIADAAEAAGVDLRVAPAAREWVEEAERRGWGERDYSAVIAHILEGRQPRA
jgi:3-hydroxyisobutyrate dehydrogenase/2-hydroxy-3-oxopropionate reductase